MKSLYAWQMCVHLMYIASKGFSLSLPLSLSCSVLLKFVIRLKAARITDSRIKVMNEVITGIRVIKMYAWEYAFSDVVNKMRRYMYMQYTCKLVLLDYIVTLRWWYTVSVPILMCPDNNFVLTYYVLVNEVNNEICNLLIYYTSSQNTYLYTLI